MLESPSWKQSWQHWRVGSNKQNALQQETPCSLRGFFYAKTWLRCCVFDSRTWLMTKKKCIQCNATYETNDGRVKYCSSCARRRNQTPPLCARCWFTITLPGVFCEGCEKVIARAVRRWLASEERPSLDEAALAIEVPRSTLEKYISYELHRRPRGEGDDAANNEDEVEANMTTKHTPGPWTAFQRPKEEGTNYWRITFTDRSSDSLVGYCGEANARLIAAAPELLEALVMVRDADNDCARDGLPTIPRTARAAIDAAITRAES